MAKKTFTHTGKKAPASGQYLAKDTKREITLSKSERVPPYRGKARSFRLVDKTKHAH